MSDRTVQTFFKSESKPRPKKKRRQIPEPVLAEIRARSGDRCEILEDGRRCENRANVFHHRRRKGQGGPDTVGNLLHICQTPHHDLIHSSQGAAWAIENGYLLSRVFEPESSALLSVKRVER